MSGGLRITLRVVLALVVGLAGVGAAALWLRDARPAPTSEVAHRRWSSRVLPPVERAQRSPERPGPPADYSPAPGSPLFRLHIPAIDLHEVVVEGVRAGDLVQGPGRYPECSDAFQLPYCSRFPAVYPGERGRVIVSGHRTTYGAPFWDLDALGAGDRVIAQTKWGRFVYRVTRQVIVDSAASGKVIKRGRKAEIMFSTCHPRFSAAQRLLVFAELESA